MFYQIKSAVLQNGSGGISARLLLIAILPSLLLTGCERSPSKTAPAGVTSAASNTLASTPINSHPTLYKPTASLAAATSEPRSSHLAKAASTVNPVGPGLKVSGAMPLSEQARILKTRLDEAAPLAKIAVLIDEENVLKISGSPDSAELDEISKVFLTFNRELEGRTALRAVFPSPWKLLPFEIQELVGGKDASIITTRQERIFLGGTIQGYRLVSIKGHRVVFDGSRKIELDW